MGYVDKNLMAGEEILLRPRYHPVRFVPGALGILLGVLVALGAVVLPPGTASPGTLVIVGVVLALFGFLAIAIRAVVDSFDEFAISSLRIIKKTGFLTRTVSQIPLDKVQDLHLVATLWGPLARLRERRGRVGRKGRAGRLPSNPEPRSVPERRLHPARGIGGRFGCAGGAAPDCGRETRGRRAALQERLPHRK